MKSWTILAVVLCLAFGLSQAAWAAPMGTVFTYQGRLIDGNDVADGLYDFHFKLYDANVAGIPKGGRVLIDDVDVIDGYFTVALDFGSSAFNGDARWLEIGVRPGELKDPNAYTTLSPRQEITPTPYSLNTRGMFLDADNTLVGLGAGAVNTGGYNTFLGYEAGFRNATGYANTFSGYMAGHENTTGAGNTFSGNAAGYDNTTGSHNTFSGGNAGWHNTTGYDNTFFGCAAGSLNTTGYYNTFSGSSAGYSNTKGYGNTFSGYEAGYANTEGLYNTFSGHQAGRANTTGVDNTFSGVQAGYSNTTGKYNTFSGTYAGYYNTIGYENTFSGYLAGRSNKTGTGNTFLGSFAGYSNTAGSGNVFIGYKAGYNETGSNKLYIANSDTTVPLIYGDFSTGRVGIGTANPLPLGGTGNFLSVNGNVVVDFGGTGDGTTNRLEFGSGPGHNTGEWISSKRTVGENQYGLDFYAGFSPRVSITNGGKVGIGTTNPSATLTINDNISEVYPVAPGILIGNQGNSMICIGKDGYNFGQLAWTDPTHLEIMSTKEIRFLTQRGIGSIVFDSDGKVGIGTSDPSAELEIYKDQPAANIGLKLNNPNNNSFRPGSSLSFYQGDNELAHIAAKNSTQDGYAANFQIEAKGSITIESVTENQTYINPSGGQVVIGAGVTGGGGFALLVRGTAAKPDSAYWSIFSDTRLKDIHGAFDKGLKEIETLTPIVYSYKKDNALGLPSDTQGVGLAAQEIQKVIPEAVHEDSRGYLTVNNDPIVLAMLNAIKELKAQKDTEIARLQAQVSDLTARLERMEAVTR